MIPGGFARMTRKSVPPDAVGLRLELAPADRDRLRVAAAMAGMSMAAYAREIILGHLAGGGDAKEKAAGKTRASRGGE
jgi:plasmid stability protein